MSNRCICRVSERQISIYTVKDLAAPLHTVGLDVAPAILMPFYDEDSSTLFVTGKVNFQFFFLHKNKLFR